MTTMTKMKMVTKDDMPLVDVMGGSLLVGEGDGEVVGVLPVTVVPPHVTGSLRVVDVRIMDQDQFKDPDKD